MSARVALMLGLSILGAGCGGAPPPRPPVTSASRFNAEGLRRLERGDLGGAEGMLRDALREAELVDDLPGQAEAYSNLGALAAAQGDPAGALAMHTAALRAHLAAGAGTRGEARARTNVGSALLSVGRRDDAAAEFARAREIARALSDERVGLVARVGEATLALTRSPEEAERLARDAAALARSLGEQAPLASALVAAGVATEARGDHAGARALYDEALSLDKAREDPGAVADDLARLSHVDERLGRRAEAASFAARRSRVLRRMGRLADARAAMERAASLATGADAESYRVEADALRAPTRPDAPPPR
ncbi:MAG: tetratricopeptide repeat protein [Polyangiaceae bacterium]|nr:tetratricopeptide repeat protein [Polyangiaceae bacterium]